MTVSEKGSCELMWGTADACSSLLAVLPGERCNPNPVTMTVMVAMGLHMNLGRGSYAGCITDLAERYYLLVIDLKIRLRVCLRKILHGGAR